LFFEIIYESRRFFRKHVWYYKVLDFINNSRSRKDISVLRRYYSDCELFLPDYPHLRHFRFFLLGPKIIKIKSKIETKDDLRRYLLRYTPVTVFYSISKWKNPVGLGSKFYKKNVDSDILLGNDLIFDVDSTNLEDARLESLKLLSLMEKWGYSIKSIRFSGSKGFHLEFFDAVPDAVIENHIEREEYFVKKRKDILARLYAEKIKLDYAITANTRSLLRLPMTINSATGYICSFIDVEEFKKKSVKELLLNIERLDYTAVVSGVDFENKLIKKVRHYIQSKTDEMHPLSKSFDYDAYFFINKVYGLRENYIPVFRYTHTLLPDVLALLRNAQKRFGLTDIYLFMTDVADEYYAFCIKTFTKQRIAKILKASRSSNKRVVFSFAPEFMRMSKKYIGGKGIAEKPELIRILKSDKDINNRSFVSKAHIKMIRRMGMYCYDYPNFHGIEDMKYYHSVILNGELKNSSLVSWKNLAL